MNPRSEWQTTRLRNQVGERDGWRCCIAQCVCPTGRTIDPTLHWRNPWSATLEHRTPLMLGGAPYDPANCGVAHRRCNVRHGNLIRQRLRTKLRRTKLTW